MNALLPSSGKLVDKMLILKWSVTILIPVMLYCIPVSEVFTTQIRMFLCVTLFVLLMMVFEFFDTMILGIMLPVLYIVTGVAPASVAFSGWLNTVGYIVIGALLFANVLMETGVLHRLSYWVMMKAGGSYNKMLYAFLILGTIVTYVTFGNCSKLMPTIAFGFCLALGMEHRKEGVILMMISGVCSITCRLLTYYPVQMGPMVAAAQTIDPNFFIQWYQPILYGWPILVFCVGYVWVLTKIYRTKHSDISGGKAYFEEEYKKLGKMTTNEKKGVIYAIVIIGYLFTSQWHGFSVDYAFMFLPWLAFVPGIQLAGSETLKKLKNQVGLIFFIVGCLGIGLVAASLNATDLLGQILTPMLANFSGIGVLYCVLALGALGNLLLTPLALITCFSLPVVQIASNLGMDLLAPLLALYYTVDMLFLPHEVPAYLYIYSFGVMSMKQFIGLHVLKNILFLIFFGLILVPYWMLLGIF